MTNSNQGRLIVSCADQPGIVASISGFLAEQGANIIDAAQFTTDPEGGLFFMRTHFALESLQSERASFEAAFTPVANKFKLTWKLSDAHAKKRMVILVSKYDHCLHELLWRWRAGDLQADISMVVSNHEDLRSTVEAYGLPYHCLPITKANKLEQEQKLKDLMGEIDLIVLARYMQILSADLVRDFAGRIINIHHSFLPAFIGANPYRQAYTRGVKLIGATAHYVTQDLDEGPIIEQDVIRVSHRQDVKGLQRVGRDVERSVLAKAVQAHLEDRVLLQGHRTIVFDQ